VCRAGAQQHWLHRCQATAAQESSGVFDDQQRQDRRELRSGFDDLRWINTTTLPCHQRRRSTLRRRRLDQRTTIRLRRSSMDRYDDRLYEDEDWIREVCELWLNRLKTIGGCSLTTTTGSLRTAMTVTIRAMSVDLHGVG